MSYSRIAGVRRAAVMRPSCSVIVLMSDIETRLWSFPIVRVVFETKLEAQGL